MKKLLTNLIYAATITGIFTATVFGAVISVQAAVKQNKQKAEIIAYNTKKTNEYIKLINNCHKYLDRPPVLTGPPPRDLAKSAITRRRYFEQMINNRTRCQTIYTNLPTHKQLIKQTALHHIYILTMTRG